MGELLGRCLRAAGVGRVFGQPVPGLPHVDGGDPATARLLADCDGRLGPGPGCALTEHVLRVSSRPGARPEPVNVTTPRDIPVAVAAVAESARVGAAAGELSLEVDLDAPAPDLAPGPPAGERSGREPLDPVDGTVVVLAGPGVVRAGAIDGLHEFAAAAGVGVANTWGAKGVFPWDSPHHMGTAGLQERDFELLGFGDAALIVATGLDPDESSPERFALAPVVAVTPDHLSAGLAVHLRAPGAPIPSNQLYARLAAVAQPGYTAGKVPLHPARAVADLRAALPSDGVVAAEPGPAGLWVARTFPTTEPGSVVVPATVAPGVAAGIALAAALRSRPAIAVVSDPIDDATRAVTALAARLGVGFVLDVWALFGGMREVEEHLASLTTALTSALPAPGVTEITVPVDASDVRFLVEAAGAVVAWGGLSSYY